MRHVNNVRYRKFRTVCIIDDNEQLLRTLLDELRRKGYHALGYHSAEAFIGTQEGQLQMDCIACDVHLPGMGGVELLKILRHKKSSVPILMFSGLVDVPTAIKCVRLGAQNLLEKPFTVEEFKIAIEETLGRCPDRVIMSQEVKQRMDALTSRQKEILELVIYGYTSREIGRILEISHRTVETQRANIMSRLGVTSMAEMIREAVLAFPEWTQDGRR